jgi:signal transduction histidine kinase
MKKALELERLRTRIATDLHDDIGATLSAISIYSEALKSQIDNKQPYVMNILSKMGENSREMVTSMSDIVWAINPDNDQGEKLINRMHNYASDLCPAKDIQLHFHADEKLNQIRLPLENRKNIYLIFKESLNNAVKYSGARNIRVQLQSEGKIIRLSVQDDGKGFDQAMVRHGNGLKNILSRAGLLGAEVKITSVLGEGTNILLEWNR